MSAVPAVAVERLRALEAWAADARAGYIDAAETCNDMRTDIARLLAGLRLHAAGTLVEVDAGGRPFTRAGDRSHFIENATAAQTGREIARLRRELDALTARRDQAGEKTQMFGEIATRCREELERRGWHPGEFLSATPGLAPVEGSVPIADAIARATARAGAA